MGRAFIKPKKVDRRNAEYSNFIISSDGVAVENNTDDLFFSFTNTGNVDVLIQVFGGFFDTDLKISNREYIAKPLTTTVAGIFLKSVYNQKDNHVYINVSVPDTILLNAFVMSPDYNLERYGIIVHDHT